MGCFEGERCFPLLSLSFSSWQHDVAAAPAAGAVPFEALPLPLPAAVAVAALPIAAAPPFRGPPPPDGPSPPSEADKHFQHSAFTSCDKNTRVLSTSRVVVYLY